MKPFFIHIPLKPGTSFVVQTFQTPNFETSWHMHDENELILFKEGNGLVYIGNYESHYKPGDIFFMGSNLPHRFQPIKDPTKALIVQFKIDCLSKDFVNLPECISLKQLLKTGTDGLQITSKISNQLLSYLENLETSSEISRIILLLQCLQILVSNINDLITLNVEETDSAILKEGHSIDKIIKYTNASFQEPLTLSQVAALACKSVPSFCYFFKRMTQKTYIHYLNEVRISHACKQLLQTNKSVVDIAYESGYNTAVHFHRQFFRLKKNTPLQYRKLFSQLQHAENLTK